MLLSLMLMVTESLKRVLAAVEADGAVLDAAGAGAVCQRRRHWYQRQLKVSTVCLQLRQEQIRRRVAVGALTR